MDMGVLVGEEIKVLKMAPLGDPIEGAVKSYSLSLRKKEAESKGYSIDVAGIETMLGITVVPTSAVKKKRYCRAAICLSLPWGVENKRDSCLGKTGAAVAPIFEPLGFGNGQAASSLITGVIAKESIL
ncbi:MAG: ferrous iron transport protein [Deltaproteobacteria bacterium]|nr:ferrous iron transport protein [Deltaproteobacteria bacterium]